MNDLRREFEDIRKRFLDPCSTELEKLVNDAVRGLPRIDRLTTRVKSVDRFLEKARKTENNEPKYSHPLVEIQDLIGVRIVVLFLEDVNTVKARVSEFFHKIEAKDLKPEKVSEFSYFGWHAVLFIPQDCKPNGETSGYPKFFELQVKTVFQHAWSEAEHDLNYKPLSGQLNDDQKRNIAFAASLAWGADRAFQDVRDKLSSSAQA